MALQIGHLFAFSEHSAANLIPKHPESDPDPASLAGSDTGSDTSSDTGPDNLNNPSGAYLVLRSAGRWSDVFRLTAPAEAVIGRASSNQIAIRNDQASRRHARIFWADKNWSIEDMGSRNGTFVNGKKIEQARPLADGDIVEVAGYAIQFSKQIGGSISDQAAAASDSSQATDDQLTMEMDPSAITDRRRFSQVLRDGKSANDTSDSSARQLLQLAFAVARAGSTRRCDRTGSGSTY